MKKQIKRRDNVDCDGISAAVPALLRQIYASRGVKSDQELEKGVKNLLRPNQLKGMTAACELLVSALMQNQRIIIIGDFDADGATSTALSMLAFKMLGYRNIDFLVPNRFEFGYGLSPEIVDLAAENGAQLIMTVDNGISSIAGVAAAKALGIKVLVTDHHLPGNEIPDADAIVNPNQHGCTFPSKNLAGVGVAFYVMLALRGALREQGWFAKQGLTEPNLACLLDIVALGTVADVVPLDANNRILVYQGLQRIRADKCRPGIKALIEIANRNQAQLCASDLGFALGPRLNAAGRLDDMSVGVATLLCEDLNNARRFAGELDSLNEERKEIESSMQQEALAILKSVDFDAGQVPYGICLFQDDWHQGVVGLVASRIKERFHRPVIAFADAGEGEIKGSARSIPGLHLRDVLELLDIRNPGMILKFGGHAMAAGLSLRLDCYDEFTKQFNDLVQELLTEEQLTGVVLSDGELPSEQLSLPTAELIKEAAPWGQMFPEPIFDGIFKLREQRLVGKKHLKMMLEPEQGGPLVDAIAFNVDLEVWPDASVQKIELAYKLDVNEFRGKRSLQFMVEHLQPLR
ncbi:single-stranded-DNA-specific exonuclease RecJ [Moritella sp.]|uniref:single-stranded-DNA-specific exonuclease RecJ n=1 Tax=Moritella sp. TaxID=78556 RepID=UPI001E015C82|nr:single-stranded-DNA-specific exonuclease RecJ [Moritella sp.]MCJ8350233.1 single-stranded-DNA-specific exonuclease RecJ [Moritella sp.]NQZ40730.1 single-stranded-DNA-specific exonuclease RecJ [Moritella sp.]